MGKKGSRACSTIRKTWKSNCHGYHTSCTNSITRVLIHPLTTIKAKAWRNQQKSTYKFVGGSKIGNHSPAWRGRIRVQSVGKHAPIVGVWDRNWCFILIVQNVCYQNAFIIFSGPLCKMLIIFDKIIIFIKFKIVIPIIPIIPPPSPWPPGLSSFQEPQALLQTKNKQIQKYPLNHRFTTWPPLENRRRRDGETKNPILKKKVTTGHHPSDQSHAAALFLFEKNFTTFRKQMTYMTFYRSHLLPVCTSTIYGEIHTYSIYHVCEISSY